MTMMMMMMMVMMVTMTMVFFNPPDGNGAWCNSDSHRLPILPTHLHHCTMGWLRSLMTPYQKFIRIWYGVIINDSVFAEKFPEKYPPLKNIHPWKIFTPGKYSPLKNIHPWKVFTPEKYSLLKNIHPCRYGVIMNYSVFDTESYFRYGVII